MSGGRGDKGAQDHLLDVDSRFPLCSGGPEMSADRAQPEAQQDKLLKRAKNTAYRYLAIRSRSRAEVEKKLRDREFSPHVISSVIDHLLRLGYLNDEQFARQWAAARVRSRGFGRRRIEQELRVRGIARDTIGAVLKGLFDEQAELDVARREADKKLRTLSRYEPETRKRRLAGFLERKGFPSEIIRAIIRSAT